MESNPSTFDEILALEESFYEDGYKQGFADGVEAGQIEGRNFGLEKGFEKYVESGILHGKSLVWANRVPSLKTKAGICSDSVGKDVDEPGFVESTRACSTLPVVPNNIRLTKHISVLFALAESESLATDNSEEAVSDFDDRLKRAQAKSKIIERMVGESKGNLEDSEKGASSKDGSIEDISVLSARH